MQALKEAIKGSTVVVVGNSTKIEGENHHDLCAQVDYVLRMQRGVLRDDILQATGTRCDIYMSRKPLWSMEDSLFATPNYMVWTSPDQDGKPAGAFSLPQSYIPPLQDELGSYPTMGIRCVDMCLRFGATPILVGFGFYGPECNEQPASQHNGHKEKAWVESKGVEVR